jgi:hypothetical protein
MPIPDRLTPQDRATATAIYDLLVAQAGAHDGESERAQFANFYAQRERSREFRFMGNLGFGGKIWYDPYAGWSINCYRGEETPVTLALIERVNTALAAFDTPIQAARRQR